MASRRPPDRKAQILAAAGELFRARGFHNVSMADTADAVGITAPAVYRHFRNKQDLLLHVVLTDVETVDSMIREASGLEELLHTLAAAGATRRTIGALWEREARHLPEDQRAVIREQAWGATHHLAALLRTARPELAEADRTLTALAVLAVLASRAHHRLTLPRRRFEALLHHLAQVVAHCELAPQPPESTLPAPEAVDGLRLPRRQQVLTEATRLFDERGFQSVSMADIGEAVGIVPSGVYRHFPSKTDILVTAATRGGDRMLAGLEAAVARSGEPLVVLEMALRSHITVNIEHRHVIGVLANESEQLPDKERALQNRFVVDYVDMWAQVLDRARPGRDPVETKIVIYALDAMVRYVARWADLTNRPAVETRLVELGMALLLNG
ncbi:TetR family transcriptional regulator [Streptomyces sp. NPDC050738]|uniref:TetR/AcrR family transcriptional regulator n=1 Tax=Streptomyces sp. NPDC050738 TaxID=3154744 RepID=UPI00342E721F